jgi:hypothetical protein
MEHKNPTCVFIAAAVPLINKILRHNGIDKRVGGFVELQAQPSSCLKPYPAPNRTSEILTWGSAYSMLKPEPARDPAGGRDDRALLEPAHLCQEYNFAQHYVTIFEKVPPELLQPLPWTHPTPRRPLLIQLPPPTHDPGALSLRTTTECDP